MDKHLWATGSVSWMGALRYIAHLLPLLRLLRFIINARNRSVTLVGSSLALNDYSTFIFWLISYPPIHALVFETRQEQNRLSLRVPISTHLLRDDILSAMCHVYGQDVLVVSIFLSLFFSVFLRTISYLFVLFSPSFLFIFGQFFFVAFHLLRSSSSS